jgi:hypothetical protein
VQWNTDVLVGDDLDAQDMADGVKDLLQHLLRHARVQAADVQRPLVGLGRGSANEAAGTLGRHDVLAAVHGRRHGRGDGIGVLRDAQRRRDVGAGFVAGLVSRRTRGGRRRVSLTRRGNHLVCHGGLQVETGRADGVLCSSELGGRSEMAVMFPMQTPKRRRRRIEWCKRNKTELYTNTTR